MVYKGAFSRFGLFKSTSSKCIRSSLINPKETSFSTKRKVVKITKYMAQKLSKFNSTLHSDLFIECQIKHIVRQICGPFLPATTS